MSEIELNNKMLLPFIGLGTYNLGSTNKEQISILNMALEAGYRLFDTANGYNNETVIGKFIKNSPVSRSEIIISSKLNDDLHSYTATINEVSAMLDRLQTNYIDLFLIHNPNSSRMRECMGVKANINCNYWIEANIETWFALEECVKKGMIKSIGVSNFEIRHLDALLPHVSILPALNQIRYCVGCYKTQEKLINYCQRNSIQVQGYSPFGKGNAIKIQQIIILAEMFKCTPENIIMSYLYKKHIPTVIKASSFDHLSANINPNIVDLSDKEIQMIETIQVDENWAKIKNPDTGEKYN